MTEQEIIALMRSSKSEKEWNDNCDRVKEFHGGYPSFWYRAVVLSGVAAKAASSWPVGAKS